MEHPLKPHVVKDNDKETPLREIEEDKEECSVTDKKNSRIQKVNLDSGLNIKPVHNMQEANLGPDEKNPEITRKPSRRVRK